MEMTGSLEDAINVVQVEASELGDVSMDGICAIDIDVEEQQHILSETGAHVVVNTETELITSDMASDNENQAREGKEKPSTSSPASSLPTVPFSFPGQTFDAKCQKLILNVWDFFRRVKKNPDLLDEIRTPQERAAAALHISAATIGKIGKNFRKNGKLEVPGKRRQRTKPVVDSVTHDQEQVIRDIIRQFKSKRITPTIPLMLKACRERIRYRGGATSLRRILQRMGYKGLGSRSHSNVIAKWNNIAKASSSGEKSSQSVKEEAVSDSDQSKADTSYEEEIPIPIPTKKSKVRRSSSSSSSPSTSTTPIKIERTMKEDEEESAVTNVVSNLLGGSLVQVGSSTYELYQPSSSNQQGRSNEPQTLHVLRPDNTIQQIQIIYANIE